MEVLNRGRIPRLEIPAACALQGAMELLGVEQNPQQVMCPNSSSKLPQSSGSLGMAAPSVLKDKGRTDAKEDSDHQGSGDNPLTPVSRIEVTYREADNLLPEIKKREESSNEGSGVHRQTQRSRSHEANENRPYALEDIIARDQNN